MAMKQLTLDGDGFQAEEIDTIQPNGTIGNDGVWSNREAVPITTITAVVPATLINKLASIEQKVNSRMEFGVFVKGHLENGEKLIVEDSIYIPQQEVTGASVDFQEDEPDPSFNGVCHRHPSGVTSFSSVDATSINRNYEFSLLYVNGDIKTGIINLKCGNYRYQLPLRVIHGYEDDIDISKIRNKVVIQPGPKFIRSGNTVINTATMTPVNPATNAYKEYQKLQKKMKKNGIMEFDSLEELADAADDDNVPTWVE